MLDAPVSGSVVTLEQGSLSIMAAGDKAAFERVKPILQDIGPTVTYVGENGLAVSMKVATNLSLAVQMLAFSEGVLLAEKSGIKRETAVEVLLNSVIASPMVKYRGPFVLGMPDEACAGSANVALSRTVAGLKIVRSASAPTLTRPFLFIAGTTDSSRSAGISVILRIASMRVSTPSSRT